MNSLKERSNEQPKIQILKSLGTDLFWRMGRREKVEDRYRVNYVFKTYEMSHLEG